MGLPTPVPQPRRRASRSATASTTSWSTASEPTSAQTKRRTAPRSEPSRPSVPAARTRSSSAASATRMAVAGFRISVCARSPIPDAPFVKARAATSGRKMRGARRTLLGPARGPHEKRLDGAASQDCLSRCDHMLGKLRLQTRAELVRYAQAHGLLTPVVARAGSSGRSAGRHGAHRRAQHGDPDWSARSDGPPLAVSYAPGAIPRAAATRVAYAAAPAGRRWIPSPQKKSGWPALAPCQSARTAFGNRPTSSASMALFGASHGRGTLTVTKTTRRVPASTAIIWSTCWAVNAPLFPRWITTASPSWPEAARPRRSSSPAKAWRLMAASTSMPAMAAFRAGTAPSITESPIAVACANERGAWLAAVLVGAGLGAGVGDEGAVAVGGDAPAPAVVVAVGGTGGGVRGTGSSGVSSSRELDEETASGTPPPSASPIVSKDR